MTPEHDCDHGADLKHLAELLAQREQRWAWQNIDSDVQHRFGERLAQLFPEADPESAWEAMPIEYRREIRWHLTTGFQEWRAVWDAEERRIAAEADEATVEAFRVLTELEAS